jgi:hypothetical protein
MCIGLLPKDVGNHILSYTTAWIDFMLLHILEKYGLPFFKKLMCEFVAPGYLYHIKKSSTGIEIIKVFNSRFHIYPETMRNNVAKNIKRGLDYRQQQIILKKQNLITKRIEKKHCEADLREYITHIEIGSVLRLNYNNAFGIIVNKSPLNYTIIKIYNKVWKSEGVLNIRVLYLEDYEFENGVKLCRMDYDFIPVSKITLKNNVELIIKKSRRASKKTERSIRQQIIDAELAPLDEDQY